MNDNNASMTPETICKKQFWNNTINNITLGFMMSALTLNFWGLQYILPSIGAVLLYIVFRNLKQENKFLYSTWIFSIVNMIINMTNLIYLTTPLNVKFEYTLVKTLILTAFKLIFLIAFREGIKNIFHNNNKKLNRYPILMLIIWNILVVICATILL